MPYTMSLFPDELGRYPAPKVGDAFIVTRVDENMMDFHWGRCTHIELVRITPTVQTGYHDPKEART